MKAVLAPTVSGHTARMIAKYRPGAPVIAITASEEVSQEITLVWGIYPIIGKRVTSTDEILELSVEESIKHQYVKSRRCCHYHCWSSSW